MLHQAETTGLLNWRRFTSRCGTSFLFAAVNMTWITYVAQIWFCFFSVFWNFSERSSLLSPVSMISLFLSLSFLPSFPPTLSLSLSFRLFKKSLWYLPLIIEYFGIYSCKHRCFLSVTLFVNVYFIFWNFFSLPWKLGINFWFGKWVKG